MKQHYLKGIFLCLCLFASINTFAYQAVIGGICYNFSGNEAEVTYYDLSGFYNWNFYKGSVVIPESVTYDSKTYRVTRIGSCAFYFCRELSSITIPKSVTCIDRNAFGNGTSPSKIIISDIAAWCRIKFYDSTCNPINSSATLYNNNIEIKDLVIPDGVTSIGDYAFCGCISLTSVTIPNSVTSIGEYNQEIKGKTNVEIVPVIA